MMTARILRYVVPVDDQVHIHELHGDPLAIGACRRPDMIEFWAVHHDEIAAGSNRQFLVVGTGNPLPASLRHSRWHWGTVTTADGLFDWHLIEVWEASHA